MQYSTNIPVSIVISFIDSGNIINVINCLKDQTMSNFEAILVEDEFCRLDVSILKEIENDSRFRLLKQEEKGEVEASDFGLSHVNGEFVIFWNGSDLFNSIFLDKLYKFAKQEKCDIVICEEGFETFSRISLANILKYKKQSFYSVDICEVLFQLTDPVTTNKLIRTGLIRENNLEFSFKQKGSELIFIYSSLALSNRIGLIREKLIYHKTSSAITRQYLKCQNLPDIISALEDLFNNLMRFNLVERLWKTFFWLTWRALTVHLEACELSNVRVQLLQSFVASDLYRRLLKSLEEKLTSEEKKVLIQIENLRCTFLKANIKATPCLTTKVSRFTIVVPCYNVENYIHIAITSLQNQTFNDFKVILIDDGSTDKTIDKVITLISQDPRFSLIKKPNQGPSLTRNLGINLANSEYLLFLDSDDALESRCLENLNKYIEKISPELILFEANAVNFFPVNDMFGEMKTREFQKYYTRKGKYEGILTGRAVMREAVEFGEFLPSPCLSVCKLSFLRKNQIFFQPNILHEDNPYTFELLLKAEEVLVIKEKLYLRSVRPDSIMTKAPSMINAWGYYKGFLKTQNLLGFQRNGNQLSEEEELAFQKISFNFLRAAQNIRKNCNNLDLFFLFIPEGEKFRFRELVELRSTKDIFNLSPKEMSLIKFKRKFINSYKSNLRILKKFFKN